MTIIGKQKNSPERYTPLWVVELCREIYGGIDLDPCSCPRAQEFVRADRWFGPGSPHGEDGLAERWYGHVLVNYPGGKPINGVRRFDLWFRKFLTEDVRGVFVGFNLQQLPRAAEIMDNETTSDVRDGLYLYVTKERQHFWSERPDERGAPYGHAFLVVRDPIHNYGWDKRMVWL